MLNNTGLFAISPSNYINNTNIKQQDFNSFLKLDSIKLPDLVKAMKEPRPVLPSLDFVVFRRWPLVEMDNGNLLCIDPSFLLEKLGPGLYWTITNSFADKHIRGLVLTAFGHLFELYVDQIMQQIYPVRSKFFISFPEFTNGEESFDGIIHLGDHLIVLEYKGGSLTQEAKYSGKIKSFETDLDRKNKFGIGEHGGVRQLVTKIEKLFHRKREDRWYIPQLGRDLTSITKVTPVLVVQELFLQFDFMNWMLNNRFQKLIKDSNVSSAISIAPLQLIDINSLERLKVNWIAGDFRLDQSLNARVDEDPPLLSSFATFPWKRFFPSFGEREDTDLKDRFHSVMDRIRKSFFKEESSTS